MTTNKEPGVPEDEDTAVVPPVQHGNRRGDDDDTAAADKANSKEGEEESDDPMAFVLAGFTRTLLFAVKRVGMSPEVLRAFLQRKAFMRIASTAHSSSSSSAVPVTAPASTSGSSGKFKAHFVAQVLKSSVMGVAVFGVYELALARVGSVPRVDRDAEKRRTEMATTEDGAVDDAVDVVGYLNAPAVHSGDQSSLARHVGAGALAGLVQSVLIDAYELAAYIWTHRRRLSSFSSPRSWRRGSTVAIVNGGLVARRAVRDSVGFAALFGTYEAVRRGLENGGYDAVLSSQVTLGTLERYRIVTRDDSTGAYDVSALSVGAAFVAGGVAGQAHLIVNHYTHSLFGHHHQHRHQHPPAPSLPQNNLAKAVRAGWSTLPRPPKARIVAGAFVPSALCFLAFRYGGAVAERLLDDEEGASSSAEGRLRERDHRPTQLLPICCHTTSPAPRGRRSERALD